MSAYKLDVHNQLFYDEVELIDGMESCRIGNVASCDVRFRKDAFAIPVVLTLERLGDTWEMHCSEGVYISLDGVRKLANASLEHGTEGSVKYASSNSDALRFSFSLDFRKASKKFDRVIGLEPGAPVTVGGAPSCHIRTTSRFSEGELVEVTPVDRGFSIKVRRSAYGVNVDGLPLKSNAVIGNGSFLELADSAFYLEDGRVHFSSADGIEAPALPVVEDRGNVPSAQYPKFVRNTRLRIAKPDDTIEVLDPPAKSQKPKNNIIVSILPAFAMVIVCVLMRYLIPEGGAYIWLSAIMMSVGVITSLITFFSSKRDYKKDIARRDETYRAYIQGKRTEIQEKRDGERVILNDGYPDLESELGKAETFDRSLFDRMVQDDDFLEVRLGLGCMEALRHIDYKDRERIEDDDDLAKLPEELAAEYKVIDGVPVTVPLGECNAVGIVGDAPSIRAMARNMLLDLALRQYRSDVMMALVLDDTSLDEFSWARLLPHVNTGENNEIRLVACDQESRTALYEWLYQLLSSRDAEGDKEFAPRLVVFVFDVPELLRHPVSKYVGKAQSLGACFVFAAVAGSFAPLYCDYVIDMANENAGAVTKAEDKSSRLAFECESVAIERASSVARLLAPVYIDEVSLQAGLRKSLSMFEMLGIYSVEDLDLEHRWTQTNVCKSMAAPLGIDSKDDIVCLDLHEKAHGPHGLVAGTTGSGKSEILQTYILSIATLFHPYDVSFLIIDFKGGGMANQFRNLPHLVGAITNIDGREIARSLKSIRAELLKRQELFAAAGVNHIDRYIGLFKKGQVAEPLPHLVIIVDEFAELRAEQPEFMDELISASRIGRSLGVHLILATQKPSGQVSEQIWSNSRFKLCLKVQSREDSNEMIRSPLAAEIVEPGRAYFQVGNNEVFELIQSGYSGASSALAADGKRAEGFTVNQVDLAGRKSLVYEHVAARGSSNAPTQLVALVDYVSTYCSAQSIERPSQICLPPLAQRIAFSAEGVTGQAAGTLCALIGLLDDPDHQIQSNAILNLLSRNILVIGSPQTGKTNLVQTVIRSVAMAHSPQDCTFYVLDFASMSLKAFESLKHVGGIVIPSDEEGFKNLIRLLTSQLNGRRERFLSVGASSYGAYREAGYDDYPHMVVIIENISALRELYLQEEDALFPLLREGAAFGISFLVTNSSTAGLGYRYLACFDERICLFNNDSTEYANAIEGCREKLDNVPGRMLMVRDKRVLEGQVYLAFEGEREVDRADAISQFVAESNERYQCCKSALRIPSVPEVLTRKILEDDFGVSDHGLSMVLGLGYETVKPVWVDLNDMGLWALSGGNSSASAAFLRHVLQVGKSSQGGIRAYVFDGHQKSLAWLKDEPAVQVYTPLLQEASTAILALEEELAARSNRYMDDDSYDPATEPLLLVLVDNEDVIAALSEDFELRNAYESIMGRCRHMNVAIVMTGVPNATVGYNAPEPLRDVRDAGTILFLDDVRNAKLFDTSYDVRKELAGRFADGDALLVKDGEVVRIKVAVP